MTIILPDFIYEWAKDEDTMLESPCVGTCKMDPASDLCAGCYRSRDEIRDWRNGPNTRRIEVLKRVMARRQNMA